MATEADVPEPILSSTQRVGEVREDICLASRLSDKPVHETPPGELNKFQETLNLPHETGKCQAEQENMQAADNVGAEIMNSVITEGERILESSSAAVVATEETCTASKHWQADEESFQHEKEMSENRKQMQEDATNGISQETGSGENKVVEELEEKAETNDKSSDTVHLTGTSLQAVKIQELNHRIEGQGNLEEESYVDQHVEVIEDQQDSAEHKSTNKETEDVQKNEQDVDSSLEPNKGVSNTTGITVDQNKKGPIHIPDPTVISLNKDIEIAAEPCNEVESIKGKFTEEEIGKTSSEVDDKEAEKSTVLVGEEESYEATRLSEGVDNKKDEKEKSMNYSTGDILASRLATNPDIQSEEQLMSKVGEINKEPLYKSSVTLAGDESSVHEAGPETGEKLTEVSNISCNEENNSRIESSEKMEQTVLVEDEMDHKNNIHTPFAVKTEETSMQQLENPELLKVVPRSSSDDIIKESPKEVREKIEKTEEGDSTSDENCKDNENPEQEEENSFVEHKGTSSIIEELAATEISSSENRDEGGSTVVVTEDNVDDTKITKGLEQNHQGNCEERPDNLQQNEPEIEKLDTSLSTVTRDACDDKDTPIKSHEESIVESIIDTSQQRQSRTSNAEERLEKLQQNEPEKEKLDGSSSLVNADLGTTASTEFVETITILHAQEEAPIKSHEESFAEKREEDIQTHSGPIIEIGIPEIKNVPAIETKDYSEVHVPNKDANDLQVICPSTEAAIQIESKELDIISDCEPKGQTHEAYKASTEQKPIEDASDPSQSSNCTNSEHTSIENVTAEPIPTSGTDVIELQEAHGLQSENSMINESSESKDQEMKINEEACDTVTHETLAKEDDAGKDIDDVEASDEVNRAISVTDEIVEQNFLIESPLPAPTLSGEDETYKPEDNAEMNNITNQQAPDGANIAGSGEAINEQVTESSVAYNSQESTEQETVESPQPITKEAEKSEGENNTEQIIDDDNTGGLVPVPAKEDPVKNLNNEKKKAEESTGEVNWTVNRIAKEASPEEKRNEDINSYHNELVSAIDNIEKKPLESGEDLHYILQKKKSGVKLEESLPVVSNDTQVVSSSADTIPCLIKEGAPPNLEETAQKEERVIETEENKDTKDNKIAMEEDLKLVAKISEASTESIVLEPKSERDIMVVEHDTKEESEQNLKLVAETSEASTESIVLEPPSESDIMVIANVIKEGESKQDLKLVAETSEASTKSIVFEPKLERDIMVVEDDIKKGESEQDRKLVVETSEASTESIVLEPTSKRDIMVGEDDTKKGESEQDIKLAVETFEANTESIVLEPKLERDIMMVEDVTKKGEQDLKLIVETSEASTKSIVLEPKLERDIMMVEDVKKKGESEQDLKLVIKTAEASIESIILEPKSERDKMSAEGDKKGESKELDKDSKTNGEDADTEKQNTIEECVTTHILPEAVAEKSLNSIKEDQNEEDRLKTKVYAVPDLTSVSDDAGRQLMEEENTVDQYKELEVKKTIQSSEEDDTTVKMPKQDSDIYISVESIEQETVESSQSSINKAELSEVEIRKEQIIEEGLIPESIEKSPTQNLNDEKQKTQKSTGEILKNPEITKAVERIAHETSKTTESPEEILDTYPVKQEENFLDKGKKIEASLEEKNGDLFLVMVAEENNGTNELFDANENAAKKSLKNEADLEHILQKQEPGASEHFEETAKIEEKTEENNEARHDKVATEEEVVASKTYDASKSLESTVTEPNSKMDKIVVEDNTRMGESEEVHVEPETTSTVKDAEKHIMIDETIVKQGGVLEVEKIVLTSDEDDKIANTSKQGAESIEQETVESSKCITNNAEESEAENNKENAINSNIKDLIPETIGQDPVENLNDEKMKANKSSGEIFEISKTAGAAESIAHETTETLDIVDTSLEKKMYNLQDEGDNPPPIEASPEEKDDDRSPVTVTQENTSVSELLDAKENIETNLSKTDEDLKHISEKNESGEKLDQSLLKEEDETEAFSSISEKIPQLMEKKMSQSKEAPRNEEIEQNNDNNKIAAEEDLKVIGETSDASKNKESIALETKSEKDKIVDGDDIKNREYEELFEDSKDAGKGEDNEKQSTVETCHNTSSLPEPVEEKAPQTFAEEEKEEATPKIEIFQNSDTTTAAERVEQETSETTERPKELHDTSPAKQEENLHSEVKTVEASLEKEKSEDGSPVMMVEENSNANELINAKDGNEKKSSKSEEDLPHTLQKNEAGENLEQSLPVMPDEIEILSLNADKTPCLMVEGAPQNLEEVAQIEDKTGENPEEDLKVVVKTPEASKSTESTFPEHESKLDKPVVQDDMKMAESEEVHVEPDTTAMGEDAEKNITKEENKIKQCRILDAENIEQNSEEDDKITKVSKQGNVIYISAKSVEQEAVEKSQGSANTPEKSEAEYNNEYTMEDGNNRGLISETVEQDPVKSLNDEKTKAEKPSGEILEISKTAEVVESIAHEPIEASDINDTSDKKDNLQSERDNLTPTEASPEEKDEGRSPVTVAQDNSSTNELLDAKDIEKDPSKTEDDVEHPSKKNETGEKVDKFLSKDKTEAFSLNADKIPQRMEKGASQNEEAARREEEETEQNNETKDNKLEAEEELKVVVETSDASKSKESIALESKSEANKIVDGDEIKNKASEELSEDSKDTVKEEDTKKQTIMEACHASPERIGEQAFQSSAEEETEEETPEAPEITQTVNKSEDIGKQNVEEGSVAERNIEVLVREIDEEDFLRDENKDNEDEEKVGDSNLAFIENIEATSSGKETVSETLKDTAEPILTSHHLDVTKASSEEKHSKEIKEEPVEKSVSLSEAFHEDSTEEIRSKEETSIDYSDSVSVTMVKEEAGIKETEAEDRNQVESRGLVSDEKGVVEIETRERMLHSGDIKVTQEETSNLNDMMDKDNPEVGEDRIDKEQQNQVPHAVKEGQEEVATDTMPSKETLEDELNKCSTMASDERKLKSSEASETVDETSENIQAPDENKTTFVTQAMDQMLMQKHDYTDPLDVSELRFKETEKETAYKARKHKVDDLYVHELENEKGVKILRREEIGELTDQSDICTSKTLQDAELSDLRLKIEQTKDGKPFDEALTSTESSSVHPEVENAITEQEEISEGNFHEGVTVQKAAIEQKEEAYSEGHEDTSTKDDGTLTKENFESVDPDQKFEFTSEPMAEDENKQIFPEFDESKIEENNKKKQQDEKEIKAEEEPTLVAEENKELNANEITKAVISTEKATGGEQLDDIENIKEAVVEKEQGRNELHASCTVDETTNEVKDSTLVCSNARVAKSTEKTDTEILEVEEVSTRQRDISFVRQSEEQKPQDVSIKTLAEELEATKKEKILEESEDYCTQNDNAAMAIVTAEKSLEQAEQVDKLFKASHIGPEPCLETSATEDSYQSKAIDIMKLEETSCGLISDLPAIHDSRAEQESTTVEIKEASECKETKIASEAFYEIKDQGTEETDIGTTVEKKDQVPSLDHDHPEKIYATLEKSDKNKVEPIKIATAADQITEETSEIGKSPTVERMDQVQSSNSEQEERESMAVENLKANEVYESKVFSDANYMPQHQGTEESARKTSTVEILDQVPISNSEHARNESVTEENPDADATKMASNVVFKSDDKDTKDNDDSRRSPTAEEQDAYKIEEASKVASDYRAHGDESVSEDKITTDRTVSTEKLEQQLTALASATATTIAKVEEVKTKEVDMLEGDTSEDSSVAKPTEVLCLQKVESRELDFSTLGLEIHKDTQEYPTEVHEEEGQNPDAALQLKPQENNNKIECGDSSSESKDTTDLTGQTEIGAELKFETSEKTIESERVMHDHGLTESEDTEIKEKHLAAVITDIRAEEKQLKQTNEANEITQNEASNRKITEEKEAAKTHHPVSFGEETMNVSLQEDELKAEECVTEKTNTININSANLIQNEELSASPASKKIEEQVATDDRSVQDPQQVSVVNTTIKETFPNEFETKDAVDAAVKLAPINQGEETNFGSGKTETLIPRDEELGMERSQKESIRESVDSSNLIQDIQESQKTCVTTVKQIPTDADVVESPKAIVSTGNECVSAVPQEGITEVRDFEPGHTKEVHSETRGIKLEGKQVAGGSEEEKVKEPVKEDTDKISLSALPQTSSKEAPQVAEHVTKERELTASPEEIQTEEAENVQIREGKTGQEKDKEEEGDEHKKTDSSSDSPVIVDVTKDTDVKVAHKKSHGILSGVGSKVKHSISKVKKAITCNSSHHPKPASPK